LLLAPRMRGAKIVAFAASLTAGWLMLGADALSHPDHSLDAMGLLASGR
jgi:hypothetical protein